MAPKAKATDDTAKATDDVPFVAGFFLQRRQAYRVGVLLAVLVSMGVYHTYGVSTSVFPQEKESRLKYLTVLHLFSFASEFGCSMWTSFVGGLIMFHNLPRHVFGRLQAKLFPRYFQFSIIFVTLSCCARAFTSMERLGSGFTFGTHFSEDWDLYTKLVLLMINLFYMEPITTEIMFTRHILEKKLGTGHEVGQLKSSNPEIANNPELVAMTREFGKWHGMSTSVNLICLILGCVHIWSLAITLVKAM